MGYFILLNDDNLPRCDWHFCRVLEVYKSKDNKVRSTKPLVRDESADSVLNRPIQNMVCVTLCCIVHSWSMIRVSR